MHDRYAMDALHTHGLRRWRVGLREEPGHPGTLSARAARPGQVLVIFALSLVVLIGMVGLVIDLGYSFHVQRMLQAAADAGAVSGAQVLETQTSAPTRDDAAVFSAIQSAVALNIPSATIAASYVIVSGETTTVLRSVTPGSTQAPPTDTTGIQVSLAQSHTTFFVQVLGIRTLAVGAHATASVMPDLAGSSSNPGTGNYTPAIIALNPSSNHTILNNSSSTLLIHGNIIDDSNTTADSTDTFQTSSFVVDGNLEGVSPQPPDNAFYTCTVQQCPTNPQLQTCSAGTAGCPPTPPADLLADPAAYTCAHRGTAASVECWKTLQASIPYVPDPFATLPEPAQAQAAAVCGGTSVFTSTTQTGSLRPGVYPSGGTGPVTLTGPATLAACADGAPGIYDFPQGVIFNTAAGSTITITNSMIFSLGSFSTASAGGPGGPGSGPGGGGPGGGGPGGGGPGGGSQQAGIECEGTGTIQDQSPTAGPWEHVALFESRSISNTSIVFNPTNADTGTITIVGTVYTHDLANDSVPSGTNPAPPSGGSGDDVVIGSPGGGGGTGAGTVSIDGTAVCDEFLTYGSGAETITYDQNEVPPANAVVLVG